MGVNSFAGKATNVFIVEAKRPVAVEPYLARAVTYLSLPNSGISAIFESLSLQ